MTNDRPPASYAVQRLLLLALQLGAVATLVALFVHADGPLWLKSGYDRFTHTLQKPWFDLFDG